MLEATAMNKNKSISREIMGRNVIKNKKQGQAHWLKPIFLRDQEDYSSKPA
jgi:hypothetical protein